MTEVPACTMLSSTIMFGRKKAPLPLPLPRVVSCSAFIFLPTGSSATQRMTSVVEVWDAGHHIKETSPWKQPSRATYPFHILCKWPTSRYTTHKERARPTNKLCVYRHIQTRALHIRMPVKNKSRKSNSICANETCAKKKTTYADTKIRTTIIDIERMSVSLPCQLGYDRMWTSKCNVVFI